MIITEYFFLLFHFFLADISQLGIYSSSIRYVKAGDAFEETGSFFEVLRVEFRLSWQCDTETYGERCLRSDNRPALGEASQGDVW